MNHDEIDRILSRGEEILPSSGFTASVMDAVRREAAALPPIAFPWKRALPGLAIAGAALVFALIEVVISISQLVRQASSPMIPVSSLSALTRLLHESTRPEVAWLLVALLLTLLSVTLSLRLVTRSA